MFESIPLPPWAIAMLALTIPPAVVSVVAFTLNRALRFVGTPTAEAVLTELLAAIADGTVTEEEVSQIIAAVRETEK